MQIPFPFYCCLCSLLLHPGLHSPIQQEECWILFLPKWGRLTGPSGITLAPGDAKLYLNMIIMKIMAAYFSYVFKTMMITELQNPFIQKTLSRSLSSNFDQSTPYHPAQSTGCHVQGQKRVTLLFCSWKCEFSSPLEILSMQPRKCKVLSFQS